MRARQWFSSAILAAATLFAAPALSYAQAGAADASTSTAEAAQKDLEQQLQILTDRSSTPQQREEAAKRLVSRSSPEANQILLRVITDFSNPNGQVAVARALASDPTPDQMFIEPLANLLPTGQSACEAAAQALAVFKKEDRARDRLIAYVNNLSQPAGSRAVAIKAMGRLVDKRTAGILIQLLNNDENSRVRDAAADALTDMTGLSRYGQDVQAWNQWWQVNRDKTELEWSTDLLNRNAVRANELTKRLLQAREAVQRFMVAETKTEDYQKLPDAEKTKKMLSYLQSDAEDVRLAAVQIIYNDAAQFGGARINPQILEALRGMVGDSSTEVRGRVARTLATANDPGAVEALLTQLQQEKDADVQKDILAALGPLQDLRTVEPLIRKLTDETVPFSVAASAADALRDLAPILQNEKNADLAARAADALRTRLRSTDRNVSSAKLRESLAGAMAKLAHRSLLPVFRELLNPGRESPRVRIAAIRGLGALGDSAAADSLVSALNDDDKGVRLAAAEALMTTASFNHALAISQHLSEANERDPDVRAMVWKVLSALFEKGSERDLAIWAEQFRKDNEQDLSRRVRVLSVIEEKAAASGNEERLAMARQNLGQALLQLSWKVQGTAAMERAKEASEKLRLAVDYRTSHNATEAEINMPRQHLLESLLRARLYTEFNDYAIQLVRENRSAAVDVFQSINREVARLRDSKELDIAVGLIDAVRKVPWEESFANRLKIMEDQIRSDRSTGIVRQHNPYEHASALPGPAA